jgi:hypothetical protein
MPDGYKLKVMRLSFWRCGFAAALRCFALSLLRSLRRSGRCRYRFWAQLSVTASLGHAAAAEVPAWKVGIPSGEFVNGAIPKTLVPCGV